MQTHYFKARVDTIVSGISDTAVVSVKADSVQEAVERACQRHLDKDDYYTFTDEVWGVGEDGGRDRRPSTGPVVYLGTESIIPDDNGPVLLSELEGRTVTADMLG